MMQNPMMQFPQMPAMKGFEDWQKMSQANVDASLKLMSEMAKGWQAIAVEVSDYTKRTVENNTAHMERLMSAKSIEQAVELQQSFAKRAYDDYMAQVAKVNGLYANLAKEAYKPVERAMQAGH